MKRSRYLAIGCALAMLPCFASLAHAANDYGKLVGIVLDSAKTPQMGATVWLSPEASDGRFIIQLLTDQNGGFTSQRVRPGLYSVKVTLAGFLPTVEQHVNVSANLTTLVRIELDSVFVSLDQLRRPPAQHTETDDWKWVLRTSSATRPILQFQDGTVVVADNDPLGADSRPQQPRADLELSNGSVRPGSSSAMPGSMATTASYDQPLGRAGKLLVAGQMSYDQMPGPGGVIAAGLASIWVPSGEFGKGPETTLVIRQMGVGFTGRAIRLGRLEHSEQIALSDRLVLNYGAEYLMGGVVGTMTSSIRPHARIGMQISPQWSAAFSVDTDSDLAGLRASGPALESAIDALDSLPVLVWHNSQSVLEGSWHEEFSIRRDIGSRRSLEASTFHDFSAHEAVFALNGASSSDGSPFDPLYAHDAGANGSWGTRAVYREKISDNLEVAAIYAWAGALAPDGYVSPEFNLQDMLVMRYRQSVAGRVSAKLPGVGTQFTASYKWVDGPVASRQDLFGESALGIDPNLSLTMRQPLPCFRPSCHWEALADFRNLLSQGYLPINGPGGRMVLMPVERSFRGGLSFQF